MEVNVLMDEFKSVFNRDTLSDLKSIVNNCKDKNSIEVRLWIDTGIDIDVHCGRFYAIDSDFITLDLGAGTGAQVRISRIVKCRVLEYTI